MSSEPKTNRALLGAWRKGKAAAEAGQPRKSPYPDKRGGALGNVVTFSRAFERYWLEGYDSGSKS